MSRNKLKYLGELLQGVEYTSNTMIISPCGSGKTWYILHDIIENNPDLNFLYLCDNVNLRKSIENEATYKDINMRYIDQIMCYKSFGHELRYNNDYIKQFDMIICDEIQNLIDYQGFNDDTDLSHAIKELFKTYDNTVILYFTATPYYVDVLKQGYKEIETNVKIIDFTNSKEIKRYSSLCTNYFGSWQQIPKILNVNCLDAFIQKEVKCLIYTNSIDTMNSIKEEIEKSNSIFNVICIWSINNKEKLMSNEQLRVREEIINHGILPKPYNVLIINKATETGVNIYDKDMMYCIVNTKNQTERVQARGRIRHDILTWYLKDQDKDETTFTDICDKIDKILNKVLTTEDKKQFAKYLNIPNNRGKILKWNGVAKIINSLGYKITNTTKRIDGKPMKVSIIEK